MDLSRSKVLVTGGAGLIGSHIVDELVREGTKVVVYDNFTRGTRDNLEWALKNGDVTIIEGDICDLGSLIRAFKGIDYVFHEAAEWKKICQQYPRKALDINVVGTFNVLEACVIQGVKKIIVASSTSVYGEGSGVFFPTDEEHPFNCEFFDGAFKIINEQFARAFLKHYKLDFIGLRYTYVYGPRQPFWLPYKDVIMHFLNLLDENQSPAIEGDGSQTLDMIYVEDASEASILALKSNITNVFFNITTGQEISLKGIVELLIELTGKKGIITPHFIPKDAKWITRNFSTADKAKERLKFQTTTSLEDGVKKVIRWRKFKKRNLLCVA